MEHEEYVAARHARLVEHAVELGCSEETADVLVAETLEEQRRHIARSDDPDPGVRAALASRVAGAPEPRRSHRRAGVVAAAAVVALVAVAALTLTRPEPASPLPSLFGYDVAVATQVLTDAGYDVAVSPAEACEPRGLVLGSEPVPGAPAPLGTTVALRTAVPSQPGCEATYGFRSDAWDFVALVRGVATADQVVFAPLVSVHLDGEQVALLSGAAAATPASWAEPSTLLDRATSEVTSTRTAMPRLVVDQLVPPRRTCGVPVPSGLERRRALRLEVDPSPDGTDALCPVTVDLYRDAERRITAVAVLSGTSRDRGDTP
jgi:hypothetical protein